MDNLQQKEKTRLLALNERNNVSENDAQARTILSFPVLPRLCMVTVASGADFKYYLTKITPN